MRAVRVQPCNGRAPNSRRRLFPLLEVRLRLVGREAQRGDNVGRFRFRPLTFQRIGMRYMVKPPSGRRTGADVGAVIGCVFGLIDTTSNFTRAEVSCASTAAVMTKDASRLTARRENEGERIQRRQREETLYRTPSGKCWLGKPYVWIRAYKSVRHITKGRVRPHYPQKPNIRFSSGSSAMSWTGLIDLPARPAAARAA